MFLKLMLILPINSFLTHDIVFFFQLLPPSIRGVVMGLSARCVGSKIHPHASDFPDRLLSGALCIVFDSESVGFVGALARVFRRVSFAINMVGKLVGLDSIQL